MLHRNAIIGAVVLLVLGLAVHVEGSFGRTLCEHYRDRWLETAGFINCYNPP